MSLNFTDSNKIILIMFILYVSHDKIFKNGIIMIKIPYLHKKY